MTDKPLSVSRFWSMNVPLTDDASYQLNFLLTHTKDASREFIRNTVYQFQIAVFCLAVGEPCSDEVIEKWLSPDYENETRIIISHADVAVYRGENQPPAFYSINRFTEWYDANDLIEEVTYGVDEVSKIMQEMSIEPSERRSNARNGGNGVTVQDAPEKAPTTQSAIPDDDKPYFVDCPPKAQLREHLAGQTFRTNVWKIDVGIQDGKKTFTFYSSWGDKVSLFPIASASAEYLRHVPTLMYLNELEIKSHLVQLTGVFYVNVKAEKRMMPNGQEQYPTYLNLNFLDLDVGQQQALREAAEIDQSVPDDDFDFTPPKTEDDIPF